jgi:hypothetical protein
MVGGLLTGFIMEATKTASESLASIKNYWTSFKQLRLAEGLGHLCERAASRLKKTTGNNGH